MTRYIYLPVLILMMATSQVFAQQSLSSQKRERNYLKEGNELYRKERYAEAEVAYQKALQENPESEIARYNLASVLLKKIGNAEEKEAQEMQQKINQILTDLSQNASNPEIVEKSLYNLGNIAFRNNDFQSSIDFYKQTLRKNPDNDKARDNLRLAQLKKREQDQNKDKNQDQQQQQQNQDQQQQQQDKQDQQNQDQNQNKDQNKDQNGSGEDKQEQKPPQQNSGMSDMNAEQILKAVEKQESATRKKIDAQKAREEQKRSRYNTDKPW